VSPVLTVYPTDVQLQSILGCEREISRLLAVPVYPLRDRPIALPEGARSRTD